MDHDWKFLGFEAMTSQSRSPSAAAGESHFKCGSCGMTTIVGRVQKNVRTPPTMDEIRGKADPNEDLFSDTVKDVTCSGVQVNDAVEP